MVSLFSLYKTKWQKLPRFLGQKCFLGALKDTEKQNLQHRTKSVDEKTHNINRCVAVSNTVKKKKKDLAVTPVMWCVNLCSFKNTSFCSIQRTGVFLPEVCLTSIHQKGAKGDRTMLLRKRCWRTAGRFQLSEMRVHAWACEWSVVFNGNDPPPCLLF